MANKKTTKKRIIKGRDFNEDKRQDSLRSAKPFGYRFRGDSRRKPTAKEIKEHNEGLRSDIYFEGRVERADKSGRAKKGERFEKGGFVGKGELVWKKLDNAKKAEFLKENFTPEITPRTQETLVGKAYNFLPSKVKIVLNAKYANVEEYSKGGKVDRSKSAKKPRVKRTKKAIAQDKNIKALHGGKRISESGSVYYESRPNRSDENRTKKLAKGGDLKNYTSSDLPKDGSEIKIHMPEMGKFPAEDIVLKYNQDNFAFDAYRNGELSGTRITEKQVLDNLNNGSYEFKNDSNFKYKKGDVVYVYQYHSDPRNSSTDSIRNDKEEIEKYLGIDKKYIVGKKPSQQKWSKVEILEPWSEEKGWESYKVKQLDGYRKEGEFIANQSQMSKTNTGTIAIGYMEEGGEVESNEKYYDIYGSVDGEEGYELYYYDNNTDDFDIHAGTFKTYEDAQVKAEKDGYEKRPMYMRYDKGGEVDKGEKTVYYMSGNYDQKWFDDVEKYYLDRGYSKVIAEEYAKGGKIKLRDIEEETVLMPYVIAEPIAETAAELTLKDEFSKWESLSKSEKEALDEKYKNLVDEISVYLVKRANTVYTHNKSFEKDVKGKKGREVLNTFMEHWCGLVDGKLVHPISETMARYEKESKSTSFEHGGDIYPIENERKQPIKSGMILMVKDTKDEADKFVSDKPELVVEEFDGKWAIKKYYKGGEIVSFKKLNFNSHKNHNPNADILEGHIDNDSFITYGIYVEGDKKGNEFMEYYKGSNFVVGSKKPSSSRHYTKDAIPAKWKSSWDELKKEYEDKYSNEKYSKGGGINSGRDLLFKSNEPHEQKYNRKREFKKYGTNGNWFNDFFENGGDIVNDNALMVINDNKQIKHHTEELNQVVDFNTKVPAWVVSKVHRSASDLSDATHYLEGVNSKFKDGGDVGYGSIKKEKQRMTDELFKKCGVFFAFSNEQFAKNKTPLKEGEKYISIGAGGYMPKGNYDTFVEGLKEIKKFGKKKVEENNLAETEILYELNNHESFYTGDCSDVVDMFKGTYTEQQIRNVYNKHIGSQFEQGGNIEDSLLHHVLNHLSSGFVSLKLTDFGYNYTDSSNYKTIDEVKRRMVFILNENGDKEYSNNNLNNLIKEAAISLYGGSISDRLRAVKNYSDFKETLETLLSIGIRNGNKTNQARFIIFKDITTELRGDKAKYWLNRFLNEPDNFGWKNDWDEYVEDNIMEIGLGKDLRGIGSISYDDIQFEQGGKTEYQDEYGKRYDKEEAKEVGQKVAAKVYREQQGMMEQGGEIKSELTLSEIESKLGKTFGFWSVPYQVSVDGVEYRKKFGSNTYRKV